MDLGTLLSQLLGGMLVSVEIFFLTLLFSLPLGLLVALCRLSKNFVIQNLARFYISIMRGTPLALQLLVVYFGPYYLLGIPLSGEYRFWAVILAFSLNYAAYFGEIYRSGIESIPKGQHEAAEVLGYTKTQSFTRIVLPQVIKRILPSMTNEVITLVKDTALAFAITVSELFSVAKAIAAAQKTTTAFIGAGVFYYLFNMAVAFLMERAEKKLSYYR